VGGTARRMTEAASQSRFFFCSYVPGLCCSSIALWSRIPGYYKKDPGRFTNIGIYAGPGWLSTPGTPGGSPIYAFMRGPGGVGGSKPGTQGVHKYMPSCGARGAGPLTCRGPYCRRITAYCRRITEYCRRITEYCRRITAFAPSGGPVCQGPRGLHKYRHLCGWGPGGSVSQDTPGGPGSTTTKDPGGGGGGDSPKND